MKTESRTVCELRDVTYVYPGGTSGRDSGKGQGKESGGETGRSSPEAPGHIPEEIPSGLPAGKRPALSDVTLEVREGEWLALLGSNGSGKSTLAKHLNALLTPTQGDCTVFGMSTKDPHNTFAIRSAVSMVFQNPENQIVGTVVEEDAAFGPENQGTPPEEIETRVRNALAAAGLLEKRKKPTYTLSGGEKQRLAVAGALAMDTPCLVLDEPTAMLDPQGRHELLSILDTLHEGGKTIVSITHRLEEILSCDRAVVLLEGRIAWEGDIPGLFARSESFRKWGLDAPPLVSLWTELRAETQLPLPPVPTLSGMIESLCRLS
jgi:energy-coupling factor transport system ATP-binding protein